MKKYILSLMALASLAFTGCTDIESEGLTSFTIYPVITVLGDNPAVVVIGSNYADAGCKADLGGEDVTSSVITKNGVDANAFGTYYVNYTAYNSDGFMAAAKRTVYVCNPGKIDNIYMSSVSYGTRAYSNIPVIISDNGDGTYSIDDLCGGFYWGGLYPGYEPTYDFHCEGVITVDAEKGAQIVSVGKFYFSAVPSYGASTYDPESGIITINLDGDFDGMKIVLNPVH